MLDLLLGMEIGTRGANLVALQLGQLARAGPDYSAALVMNLQSELVATLLRVAKDLCQSFHHELKRMVLVVEKNDGVGRLSLRLGGRRRFIAT